jgi:hypothetical protein
MFQRFAPIGFAQLEEEISGAPLLCRSPWPAWIGSLARTPVTIPPVYSASSYKREPRRAPFRTDSRQNIFSSWQVVSILHQ